MPDKLPRGPCHLSATNHMNMQMIHTLGSISPVINHNTKSYEDGITRKWITERLTIEKTSLSFSTDVPQNKSKTLQQTFDEWPMQKARKHRYLLVVIPLLSQPIVPCTAGVPNWVQNNWHITIILVDYLVYGDAVKKHTRRSFWSSLALDRRFKPSFSFGITKKWTGPWGLISRKAMHFSSS